MLSCSVVSNPMDCSPPGSSVHGILQARIPEWVAISSSRGFSPPRDGTSVSCIAGVTINFCKCAYFEVDKLVPDSYLLKRRKLNCLQLENASTNISFGKSWRSKGLPWPSYGLRLCTSSVGNEEVPSLVWGTKIPHAAGLAKRKSWRSYQKMSPFQREREIKELISAFSPPSPPHLA